MRVALINPRFRLPIDTRTTAHLGLAYLAAMSERRGDKVVVFDADVETQSVAEFVQEFKPDLVGITANTPQVKQAWRTAHMIKDVHDCLIVLGGPHVSVLPEESCEKPYVDIIVRGEGEEAWIDISNRLESYLADQPEYHTSAFLHPENEIFQDCLGITYKTSDGRIHNNPDRTPIADLDSLPWPAYHLFKMERYTNLQPATDHVDGARSFSIMTSRGCPYRCTFCSQSIMPIKWRSRSPENVLAEWRHLVEDLGAQEIGVLDDSANIRIKRLEELATMLIENNLNHVPWIFVNGIRANLATKEMLGLLKKAGLKRTAFGVESGDPDILRSIDKKVDHDTIRQAFKNAKEVDLETIAFMIIGLPGETRETMQRTIDFAIELDPVIANFSMMTPYPGTKVYEIVKRQRPSLSTSITSYDQIIAALAGYDVPYRIHEHAPSVTIQDADTHLNFPVEQLLKTIAFRVKNQGWVLAALCGYAQVDYKRLAAAVGVSRDKLMRLEPEAVQSELGYVLGGVAPFAPNPQTQVLLDSDVLGWQVVFCGTGRNDRTLEIAPRLLVQVAGAKVAGLAKYYCE